jgi:three-Cys-motif partner protein
MAIVTGNLLPPAKLPSYAAHHAAKHSLLREYANVWLPKLGFTYPRVAIVDAFASAGRYRGSEPGSPLILLQAYTGRSDTSRFRTPPIFRFIESNRAFAEHLRAEIDGLGDLKGADVEVIHGRYRDCLAVVIEELARLPAPLPCFAFIDPLGYSETPFDLVQAYRRRLGEKAEAMVYLPVNFMARFLWTDLTEAALRSTLDGVEAVERVRSEPDAVGAEAGERIAEEYAELMRREYGYVTQFTVDPVRHNEYHLFFGTGSLDGVREMKRAYWKVDPVSGSGYQQGPREARGQGSLFGPAEVSELPAAERLPALIETHYGTSEFTIEDAELYTLLHTRFLDKPHLRKWALTPLRQEGRLQVLAGGGRRATDFPPGTRMRLRR